jgi:hypothetical protein
MATLSALFNKEAPSSLQVVTLRTEPDLSEHVLGEHIQWETGEDNFAAGYYLDNPDTDDLHLVEFIEDYWHYIHYH